MTQDFVLRRGVGPGTTPCRSCKQPIVFAVMYSSGKTAPFEIDADGEWKIENGIAKHIGKREAQQDMLSGPEPTRFTSHFARCKDADKWRKPRGEE